MPELSEPLVRFLEARIEEDEIVACFVQRESPTNDVVFATWATPFFSDPDRMVVAIDYQRVLGECAAKRRIIDAYLEVRDHASPHYTAAADYMESVLLELAAVHSAHPDYRSEWAA